jgi:hypothetical protein
MIYSAPKPFWVFSLLCLGPVGVDAKCRSHEFFLCVFGADPTFLEANHSVNPKPSITELSEELVFLVLRVVVDQWFYSYGIELV